MKRTRGLEVTNRSSTLPLSFFFLFVWYCAKSPVNYRRQKKEHVCIPWCEGTSNSGKKGAAARNLQQWANLSKPREQGTPKPCIPAERSNLQTHTWINFLLGLDTLNLESIFIAINIKVNIITLEIELGLLCRLGLCQVGCPGRFPGILLPCCTAGLQYDVSAWLLGLANKSRSPEVEVAQVARRSPEQSQGDPPALPCTGLGRSKPATLCRLGNGRSDGSNWICHFPKTIRWRNELRKCRRHFCAE